jgi:hypothetical protein
LANLVLGGCGDIVLNKLERSRDGRLTFLPLDDYYSGSANASIRISTAYELIEGTTHDEKKNQSSLLRPTGEALKTPIENSMNAASLFQTPGLYVSF